MAGAMKNLNGKTAFVTGGAGGLGLSIACAFAREGMNVAIADCDEARLEPAGEKIESHGAKVIALHADVSDFEAVQGAAEQTIAALGNVHVVVNNAGTGLSSDCFDTLIGDWRRITAINLDGVAHGVFAFARHMKDHNEGGHFVTVTSLAGLIAYPERSIYCAAKFGAVGFTETLRVDLADTNINVSLMCPGPMNTGIFAAQIARQKKLREDYAGVDTETLERRHQANLRIGASGIDPDIAGDMVVHAVRNNRFYIFTHPGYQAFVSQRAAEMEAASRFWADYSEARGITTNQAPESLEAWYNQGR